MRVEVYIPDREIEVIQKVLELKENKRLSSYIVDLLKREEAGLTEEKVIELIKKHAQEHKNTAMRGGLEDSIQSIFNGL